MYLKRFEFKCLDDKCGAINVLHSPFKHVNEKWQFALEHCVNSNCTLPPYRYLSYLKAKLYLLTQCFVHKFYENWMICEKPACDYRTNVVHLRGGKYFEAMCEFCHSVLITEYDERHLYNQLDYFQNIFDITPEMIQNLKFEINNKTVIIEAYAELKAQITSDINNLPIPRPLSFYRYDDYREFGLTREWMEDLNTFCI